MSVTVMDIIKDELDYAWREAREVLAVRVTLSAIPGSPVVTYARHNLVGDPRRCELFIHPDDYRVLVYECGRLSGAYMRTPDTELVYGLKVIR